MSEEKKDLVPIQDVDAETLRELTELASRDNEVVQPRLPILKINYDETSKFKRGTWVVGQIKDKSSKITDEGKQATHFIILKVKNAYSYYNPDDTTKNCYSNISDNFKGMVGSKYGICGNKCIYRSDDATPKCSAQKVVFGVALVKGENGEIEKVDCIARIKGKSYMPFVEYYTALPKVKVTVEGKSKEVDYPVYAFLNKLESEAGKNGALTYYVAKLSKEKILAKSDIIKLAEKAQKIDSLVGNINSASAVSDDDESSTTDFSRKEDVVVKESTVISEAENEVISNLFE
jgi:hypothetical protein